MPPSGTWECLVVPELAVQAFSKIRVLLLVRLIRRLVFHHTVDDVNQTAHYTDQRLRFGLAFADLAEEIFTEHRLVWFAAVGAYRYHADCQKVEKTAQLTVSLFIGFVMTFTCGAEVLRRYSGESRQLVGIPKPADVADLGDQL